MYKYTHRPHQAPHTYVYNLRAYICMSHSACVYMHTYVLGGGLHTHNNAFACVSQ